LGRLAASSHDPQARDPFEPDAPLTPAQIAARNGGARNAAGARIAGSIPSVEKPEGPDVLALSPRELYEMLMSPPAQPTRSSPMRLNPDEPVPAKPAAPTNAAGVPADAELILSALEAGRAGADAKYADRRGHVRKMFRARVSLRLFSDAPSVAPWTLYSRDVHSRGLGFITPHRLPLGYGGMLEMPNPADPSQTVCIPCTLLRCREAAPGWFEGSLYFNREQPAFDKF
jgi:hypothetical protein